MKIDVLQRPEEFAAHVANTLGKRMTTPAGQAMEWHRSEELEDNEPDGEVLRTHYDLELATGSVRVSCSDANIDGWYYAVTVSREGVEIGRAEFGDEGVGKQLYERVAAVMNKNKQLWADEILAELHGV